MSDKPEKATVDGFAEAKPGDWVWVYDSNANRYVDGMYVGRGAYRFCQVTGVTRISIEVGTYGKFDKSTGLGRARNGFSPMTSIHGEVEKADREYCSAHRRNISKVVDDIKDAVTLRRIAKLVGYEDGT